MTGESLNGANGTGHRTERVLGVPSPRTCCAWLAWRPPPANALVLSSLTLRLLGAGALAGLSAEWRLVVGDAMSAVMLLLAMLKNSERRAEHAIQRKLDAIVRATLEQQGGQAHEDLKAAIRMNERL
ncbi:hypothetical protein [Streptomyces yanii]|uniref:Uncharacterized protein n=1 Tax=Streptomyces yanii TaxID=78510 RepID=A0ABV5RQL4_9ACTN